MTIVNSRLAGELLGPFKSETPSLVHLVKVVSPRPLERVVIHRLLLKRWTWRARNKPPNGAASRHSICAIHDALFLSWESESACVASWKSLGNGRKINRPSRYSWKLFSQNRGHQILTLGSSDITRIGNSVTLARSKPGMTLSQTGARVISRSNGDHWRSTADRSESIVFDQGDNIKQSTVSFNVERSTVNFCTQCDYQDKSIGINGPTCVIK